VQTVGLTWQHSFETAAVLTVAGGAMALSNSRPVRAIGAFARETAVIGVLYALWRLAGEISVTGTDGALRRAQWIQHAERYLPLPSEHSAQQAVLGQRLIIETANLYYAAMHMTMMLTFLIWLFIRHRAQYRPVRQVMAWTTLGCLLVQLMPVAPPRMLPGIVDTGLLYGQSVYSSGLPIDQLSAMPSVHVAWAVIVGYYTWRISASRWRWIGPAHSVITILVVVVTGNHWWLDGIVAVAILVICAWGVYGVRAAWRALLGRLRLRLRRVGEPDVLAGERQHDAARLSGHVGEREAERQVHRYLEIGQLDGERPEERQALQPHGGDDELALRDADAGRGGDRDPAAERLDAADDANASVAAVGEG
jgi:PAP2 superfamily